MKRLYDFPKVTQLWWLSIHSRLINPDLQIHALTISRSRSSSKPKIHSGRDIPDFLGLFLEEIRFRQDWTDFRKAPKGFKDGDLMHSFMHSLIQKDLMSEDKKEVKMKRQDWKSLFSSCSLYSGIAPRVNRQWWYRGIRAMIGISTWCWES